MHKYFVLLLCYLHSLLAAAQSYSREFPVSQVRAPDQDWEVALSQQLGKWGESTLAVENSLESVLLQNINLEMIEGVPEWPHGLAALNNFVQQTRHVRIYSNPNPGNYKRKAPWLYPVDGCYAKAAHVAAQASARGLIRPGKVFAYGRLRFDSPYARRGRVWWSYHVAAAYHIGATVYVLDPMVNGATVLTLQQWLSQISSDPNKVRVKLCDSNAYSPSSRCRGSNGNGAYLGHIRYVLQREYNNLHHLGFTASKLLGP